MPIRGQGLDWETHKGLMRTRYPALSEAQRQSALNRATHELEREEKVVDFAGFITRTGVRTDEPYPRPIEEVVQALLALDWTQLEEVAAATGNWQRWICRCL
jgi:hypothetical protein